MQSTMQDYQLTILSLMRHGTDVYGRSEVVTWTGEGTRRATFAQVGARAARLATALAGIGVGRDDRVATFQWNNQEHLEAYLAVPSMGAVLHTLNIRLFPEQLVYIAGHAEDKVVIVDASLVPGFATLLPEMKTVEHVIVVGEPAEPLAGGDVAVHSYEDLLAAATGPAPWAEDLDERDAAAMCYTSGTTGNPKGVVYSHRSAYLHSMSACMGTNIGLNEYDRVLPVVPMFHANAWGLPYASWLTGADLLMPDRFLSGEMLARFISAERATVAGGVPTIWSDLLRYTLEHRDETDLTSLRVIPCGGSAVPRSLIEAYQDKLGLTVLQAWGMTETSPVAATSLPPKDVPAAERMGWRARTGRLNPAVECRIVSDDGTVLPRDGVAVGEFEVRGPWITGSYYGGVDPERFTDGWLRTGDVGTVDDRGFMQITDRSKDVIKSGGEWISSVELENALMGHPQVVEAAVVAIPDERWQERPLAAVVLAPDATVTAGELRTFLSSSIAKWQLPENWAFVEVVPKTSVGKFDKKEVRRRHAQGELAVVQLDG